MKAITLWQPWASAIAHGWKQNETRGRRTLWRGPIAIHAAKVWGPIQKAAARRLSGIIEKPADHFDDLPRGFVVCTANLVDCVEMTEQIIADTTVLERAFGDWRPGRWAWCLEDVEFLQDEPFKLKGRQSMWTLTREQTQEIRRRLS